MVKLVPKLPPPSRRALIRLEREVKRAARLANPSQPGEPREHLALLLSQSKRTRYKRPDLPAFELEQAKKKWEKNQRCGQSRRWAKALAQRNVIEEGSEGLGNHLESSLLDVSYDQAVIHPPTPSVRSVSDEGPATSPADSSSELHETVISPADISSSLEPCGLALASGLSAKEDPDSTSLESLSAFSFGEAMKDTTADTSLGGNDAASFPVISSVLQKENKVTSTTEPSRTSTIPQPIRVSLKAIRPDFASRAHLDVSIRVPSLRRLRFFADVSVGSSQASSESSIFSEPLDLSKFSDSKSVRPSQAARSSWTGRFPARQPLPSGHNLEFNGPPNFLGYSLSSGQPLVTVSSAFPPTIAGTLGPSRDESGSTWRSTSTSEMYSPLLMIPYNRPSKHSGSLPSDNTQADVADVDDLFCNAHSPRPTNRGIYPWKLSRQIAQENTVMIENYGPQRIADEYHQLYDSDGSDDFFRHGLPSGVILGSKSVAHDLAVDHLVKEGGYFSRSKGSSNPGPSVRIYEMAQRSSLHFR